MCTQRLYGIWENFKMLSPKYLKIYVTHKFNQIVFCFLINANTMANEWTNAFFDNRTYEYSVDLSI